MRNENDDRLGQNLGISPGGVERNLGDCEEEENVLFHETLLLHYQSRALAEIPFNSSYQIRGGLRTKENEKRGNSRWQMIRERK